MLTPVHSTAFRRDVRKAEKRGKDLGKLRALLTQLIEQQVLPERYRDHPLKGSWARYGDANIERDWLLLCRIDGNELHVARTGIHPDLLEE